MPSVVTANALGSGAVVYLSSDGKWIEALAGAAVAEDATQLKALEEQASRAVEEREVTGVYAMDVNMTEGQPAPVSVRERIRAAGGPSV